jgi:hypothetical protein
MELRAANVHASSGAWNFLEQALDKLPASILPHARGCGSTGLFGFWFVSSGQKKMRFLKRSYISNLIKFYRESRVQ